MTAVSVSNSSENSDTFSPRRSCSQALAWWPPLPHVFHPSPSPIYACSFAQYASNPFHPITILLDQYCLAPPMGAIRQFFLVRDGVAVDVGDRRLVERAFCFVNGRLISAASCQCTEEKKPERKHLVHYRKLEEVMGYLNMERTELRTTILLAQEKAVAAVRRNLWAVRTLLDVLTDDSPKACCD